jgi:hypothetical protein
MLFNFKENITIKQFFFLESYKFTYSVDLFLILGLVYGSNNFVNFIVFNFFEFHKILPNVKSFTGLGLVKSKNFFILFHCFIPSKLTFKTFFYLNLFRFRLAHFIRGIRYFSGYPIRGQRTRSNYQTVSAQVSTSKDNISDILFDFYFKQKSRKFFYRRRNFKKWLTYKKFFSFKKKKSFNKSSKLKKKSKVLKKKPKVKKKLDVWR